MGAVCCKSCRNPKLSINNDTSQSNGVQFATSGSSLSSTAHTSVNNIAATSHVSTLQNAVNEQSNYQLHNNSFSIKCEQCNSKTISEQEASIRKYILQSETFLYLIAIIVNTHVRSSAQIAARTLTYICLSSCTHCLLTSSCLTSFTYLFCYRNFVVAVIF